MEYGSSFSRRGFLITTGSLAVASRLAAATNVDKANLPVITRRVEKIFKNPAIKEPNDLQFAADGNLWIRTIPAKPIPGGLVYDIVNSKGELFDRLQLPPGYTLVGFGKGKVVYLSTRDAKGIHLARVRLK